MWVNPIFDRTIEDVQNKTNKAYCNHTDLNRIENNCKHLSAIFGAPIPAKTNWGLLDFPNAAHMSRIQKNISLLRSFYYTYQITPSNPLPPLNAYGKWNDAEKILNDMYALYQDNLNAKTYTGEIYTDQGIGVI